MINVSLFINRDNWWYILLIAVGVVILVFAIIFLIVYLSALKQKKVTDSVAKSFFIKIVDSVGGYDNIEDVFVNSSRLSLVLKNNEVLNTQEFKDFVNQNSIGVVKSSKKVTLVVGEFAIKYYESIKKELNK